MQVSGNTTIKKERFKNRIVRDEPCPPLEINF